ICCCLLMKENSSALAPKPAECFEKQRIKDRQGKGCKNPLIHNVKGNTIQRLLSISKYGSLI
ncbi:hypothetical protein, partial [Bacillus wiedmannii]|uniref:hypothetical protein n=1 Tax=Bacillus wiedmannii TaxID=1890302 RepID=UPI000BFAEF36